MAQKKSFFESFHIYFYIYIKLQWAQSWTLSDIKASHYYDYINEIIMIHSGRGHTYNNLKTPLASSPLFIPLHFVGSRFKILTASYNPC